MTGQGFYTALWRAAIPVLLLRLVWRGVRNRAYWRRWPERFGRVPAPLAAAPIWVHAVSVGETLAASGLVRALLQEGLPVLVTTTTPTGSERVHALFGDAVSHCYLPFDLPGATARFLDRARPRLAVIMETELWPNLFAACRARSIPLLVANARLSERSAAGYARFPRLTRAILDHATLIATQGRADRERFIRLGADPQRVVYMGNIKYDLSVPHGLVEQGRALRRRLGAERPVWIAASTRDGEEGMVLDAFARVRQSCPPLLLLLVPRHPERFGHVEQLCRERGYRTVRRSTEDPVEPATDVFLGDTLGELLLFYAAADVAYVGGSLVALGGHNPLEPAALALPIVMGPHLFNFREIADDLQAAGALSVVADSAGLAGTLATLLADPAECREMGERARRVVDANRGVQQRLLDRIEETLEGA